MQLKTKVFLITGAGSGLGAACARLFAENGSQLILGDINSSAGENVAAELDSNVRFVKMDVTNENSVQKAIDSALESFGQLNGAIHCAGICPPELIIGKSGPHSLASFARVVEINLTGTFNVLRLAAMAIMESAPDNEGERGAIINAASVAAFEGQIGQASYAASKGGVAALTLPAARELARYGIRVAAIAPGVFDTPMMTGLPDGVKTALSEQVPFPPRLGRPEEFAQLARHIVENRMLNGVVIRLDGALRLPPRAQ
jgi:NAD(P)-dependent dehydrogenase (short-subunit alcohol dehydrogenase family)